MKDPTPTKAKNRAQWELIMRWMRLTWRGSGRTLFLIVVLSFGSAVLLTAFPWLWQYLVDEVRQNADPVRMRDLAGWMALVGFAHFVLYLVLQGARSVMNSKLQWRARRRVFHHLSRLDAEFYQRWRSGDLVTRLTDDAGEKLSWFLCSGVFRTVEAVLIVLVCLGAMILIDPGLTLWVVLPLPLLIFGQAATQGALGRRYRKVQQSISHINDELTTTFAGIRIVQACRLQPAVTNRFEAQAAKQMKAEVRVSMFQQIVYLMYGFGWQAAVVALLLAGGSHVIDGQITLGQFVAFEGFVMTLVWPMFDVGTFVSKFKQIYVALDRLQDLVDEPSPDQVGGSRPLNVPFLELRDVASNAPDGATLLRNVTLIAKPGETLAIVGAIGSGKSVLMELVAGIRVPSSGQVLFSGELVERLDRSARHRMVGYVPQDPLLLSASIRENILLGRTITDAEIQHALAVSRLEQDLPVFPEGLHTEVGERGVTLSGGQQQRVALARALVGRPSILLLDDATAALDADTEAAFWDQLATVLPELTVVVVTHRVATMQQADRVIVLEDGEVAQTGVHEELIQRDGPYRRIYGGFEALDRLNR